MKIFNIYIKSITSIFFVIIFLSTQSAKALDNFNRAKHLSNYFSGILLLNDNQYDDSFKYFKKLDGLETNHKSYSVKYLYSLVNSGNFKEAVNYSKKLEKKELTILESHLILGTFYLKNSKKDLAKEYFLKAKNKNSQFILNNYMKLVLSKMLDFDK